MSPYYLAVDIGASSGRHILGWMKDGRLITEEIYRFDNVIQKDQGLLTWDVDTLFFHLKAGLRRCKELGKPPVSVAIDTWGVDYVLLDGDGKELLPAVCYRDGRTAQVQEEVSSLVSHRHRYERTGIQHQPFNTLFQLYRDKKSGKLRNTSRFLMMPDYLSYKLTGQLRQEYTNATTTGLVCALTKSWDWEMIDSLGLPRHLFGDLSLPGTPVGSFSEAVRQEVGFDSQVVLCASHDTASAVAACPLDEKRVFLSSGTWSLMGIETSVPILSESAMEANFTNEGGVDGQYRFLKNIPGMWLFQSIRREMGGALSYDERMSLAMGSSFTETVDVTSPDLTSPESMLRSIRKQLGRPDLPLEDVLASVYHSLAKSYATAVDDIEQLSGRTIDTLCLVGGGSRDTYLNRLTAQYTGKKVYTGLIEATAVGNLLLQMMHDRGISLTEARAIVTHTFDIKETV